MGLDVKVLNKNNDEIDLKQNFDDDDDINFNPSSDSFDEPAVADDLEGYTVEETDDDILFDDTEAYVDETADDAEDEFDKDEPFDINSDNDDEI